MAHDPPRRTRDVRGWIDRALLSIMGPPQLGDANQAAPERPSAPREMCPRCHQPRDEHEVIRSPELTWSQCPGGAS